MKTRSIITLGFAAGIILFGIVSASSGENHLLDEGRYLRTLETSRRAWALSCTGKSADANEALELLASANVKADHSVYAIVEMLKCRLYYQSQQAAKAQSGFLSLIDSRSVAPECVLGLVELSNQDVHVRTTIESDLARILPLTVWSTQLNARNSKLWADIKPPRPNIPDSNAKRLTDIAEAFERVGLHSEAWKAFVEAAYAGAPSWIEGAPNEGAWFSQDRAELWERAASNAWKSNEHSLACDYLAKFAIFGSGEQFEQAKGTLRKWEQDKMQHAVTPISKTFRNETLHEIIQLYGQLNAHPRGFELIDAHLNGLKTSDEVYSEYSKQWQAILKSYGRESEGVVVYGVKATDKSDPSTIRIPRACTPSILIEVKSNLLQLLNASAAES